MPPIRFISVGDDFIQFQDKQGITRTLNATDIPVNQDTIAKKELFINAWLASNITGYQMRVHVLNNSPLRVAVGAWNEGSSIPASWWMDT